MILPPAKNSFASTHPGFVLIVDDDADFVAQLTAILRDRGYLVLGARDAISAQRLLDQHLPEISLVIIDLYIPNGNGFEFIGTLARLKTGIKILAVSQAEEGILHSALNIGADAIVQKPRPGDLLQTRQWFNAVSDQIGLPGATPAVDFATA